MRYPNYKNLTTLYTGYDYQSGEYIYTYVPTFDVGKYKKSINRIFAVIFFVLFLCYLSLVVTDFQVFSFITLGGFFILGVLSIIVLFLVKEFFIAITFLILKLFGMAMHWLSGND